YVLVEMIMSDESWFVVRNTPGVTGFVGSHGAGSKPAPLLPEEVEHILHDMDNDQQNHEIDLQIGETVKIVDGAFAGLEGKVTATDDEHGKVKVEVDMFGRLTETELDYNLVQKF
ncbi:transcription termination/antitermination protein NusG, partial [Lactobacillus sp. XV13L]|nr:transcription termination/antitermination protein NusG [Lactobacillus sp. XV13L]